MPSSNHFSYDSRMDGNRYLGDTGVVNDILGGEIAGVADDNEMEEEETDHEKAADIMPERAEQNLSSISEQQPQLQPAAAMFDGFSYAEKFVTDKKVARSS